MVAGDDQASNPWPKQWSSRSLGFCNGPNSPIFCSGHVNPLTGRSLPLATWEVKCWGFFFWEAKVLRVSLRWDMFQGWNPLKNCPNKKKNITKDEGSSTPPSLKNNQPQKTLKKKRRHFHGRKLVPLAELSWYMIQLESWDDLPPIPPIGCENIELVSTSRTDVGWRWSLMMMKRLHSLKLTFSPLKIDAWNTTFLLRRSIFRGYVSFREGIVNDDLHVF